jgi:hypothetical protein
MSVQSPVKLNSFSYIKTIQLLSEPKPETCNEIILREEKIHQRPRLKTFESITKPFNNEDAHMMSLPQETTLNQNSNNLKINKLYEDILDLKRKIFQTDITSSEYFNEDASFEDVGLRSRFISC